MTSNYNIYSTPYAYMQNNLVYISIIICSRQGRRIHATIQHDDVQTFVPDYKYMRRTIFGVTTYAEAYSTPSKETSTMIYYSNQQPLRINVHL